ncbi:cupin domain-containing protein [Komagataeibacter sp. FNDCF1]|uniref:cupin domain-containing protein n=1 Tax=Komagataeibacter sp. FNDCF1 TaxID=2878681 RepID=UPI001E51AFC9|nr:cupin domain-containing protein [Komagataeibacter sp. FNDCF1]MCE2566341.1 cupin domain-containing protein [Komagataeibacter sp. FNDCF1]
MDSLVIDPRNDVRDTVAQGQFYEYSKAANPIRPTLTPRVPYHFFSPSLYADGESRIVPLDLSTALKCPGPATGPGLLASFVRINAGDTIEMEPNATSIVFYVIRGQGRAVNGDVAFEWNHGDFFAVPAIDGATLTASSDAALYAVHDAPLLTYLGVRVDTARFRPVLFRSADANRELDRVRRSPAAAERSRISVLLAAEEFPLTRTVTHTLWAMYGTIGAGTEQKPHRHQSIALDYIVECEPGCYSLVGTELDENGQIKDPTRVDWESGCVFVTPPGYWHAHFNESGAEARLIPIQDAGLQTYLRTLDIRFA